MIAAVGALVAGATRAFFSDTETSVGNTFTAGTIDIDINEQNPWTENFDMGDLKPGEIGYINFRIGNVGENPVNISKKLYNFTHTDIGEGYDCGDLGNVSSEPECEAETLAGQNIDNVETQFVYDLSVEVYDIDNNKIWWQEIYNVDDGKSLTAVYGESGQEMPIVLGMIPVDGYMLVTQSYHFSENAGNEYQGDGMKFDMDIIGDQLTGVDGYASVTLENKGGPDAWLIIQDDYQGTLNYKTQGPKFEYTFTAKAPVSNQAYVLAIGYDANTDVDTKIGEGTTDNDGNIVINGNLDLNADMTNAKAWLVPVENWTSDAIDWSNWPTCISNILWEVGLINYDDIEVN